ncbi:hypothetical protein F4Y93_04935 [Candidatus Poribacteria bacterium]|nr:hypothetical protein [Candidatus Poribacteria bacterium]
MMRFFAVLFVLAATHTIDARQPWPPKHVLGKDLPKDLSAAYRFVSEKNSWKFPYPDEVQSLFYDYDVRMKFWFMVSRMMEVAKRGNGKVLPEDEAKLKAALQNFLVAIFSNDRFLRLSKLKQRKIATGMRDFGATEIAGRIIYIHSLAELERFAKEKNQSR